MTENPKCSNCMQKCAFVRAGVYQCVTANCRNYGIGVDETGERFNREVRDAEKP